MAGRDRQSPARLLREKEQANLFRGNRRWSFITSTIRAHSGCSGCSGCSRSSGFPWHRPPW